MKTVPSPDDFQQRKQQFAHGSSNQTVDTAVLCEQMTSTREAEIVEGAGSTDARRRSVPGSNKSDDSSLDLMASTSQEQAAVPFRRSNTSWYWKIVKREAPLMGLLATGTGMVALNQFIAAQVSLQWGGGLTDSPH